MSRREALRPGDLIVSKQLPETGRKFSECAVILTQIPEIKHPTPLVRVRWFTGGRTGHQQDLPLPYVIEKFDVLEMEDDDSRRS